MPTERGYGSLFARAREDLLAIETVADSPVEPLPIPVELREIEPIDTSTAVERTIDLTIGFGADKRVEMGMNGVPHWRAEPIEVTLGDTEVWNIVNDTDFAHPFHMHGYFFQVQDDARVPEWKDTVDVPAHSQRRIAIRFDERPGAWMYHCHILDHAERGMMGHLNVVGPGERPEPPAGGPTALTTPTPLTPLTNRPANARRAENPTAGSRLADAEPSAGDARR